jgi:hypothetical protein
MTTFYCLRFKSPQPGGPGSHIYIPEEQGGPVIAPGTDFPFHCLLQLAGLQSRYANRPPRSELILCLSSPYITLAQITQKTPFLTVSLTAVAAVA